MLNTDTKKDSSPSLSPGCTGQGLQDRRSCRAPEKTDPFDQAYDPTILAPAHVRHCGTVKLLLRALGPGSQLQDAGHGEEGHKAVASAQETILA